MFLVTDLKGNFACLTGGTQDQNGTFNYRIAISKDIAAELERAEAIEVCRLLGRKYKIIKIEDYLLEK